MELSKKIPSSMDDSLYNYTVVKVDGEPLPKGGDL